MRLAPAVIVHGADMASWALSQAAALGRDVTLLSAPGAAGYAGVGWWQALMTLADPAGGVAHILDCGAAPGRALEALRANQKWLVLRAEPRIWTDIAERAVGCGATLMAEPPPALDLAVPGARRKLEAWLQQFPVRP